MLAGSLTMTKRVKGVVINVIEIITRHCFLPRLWLVFQLEIPNGSCAKGQQKIVK
jgi:hypothetical protein